MADKLSRTAGISSWTSSGISPLPKGLNIARTFQLVMDKYGRLATRRRQVSLAQGGKGFKPLADYVHPRV